MLYFVCIIKPDTHKTSFIKWMNMIKAELDMINCSYEYIVKKM